MRAILFIIICQWTSLLFANDSLQVYYVQPGDSLSEIAQSHIGEPVYPKNGSLNRLLAMNPQILNPKIIEVGQAIYLPSHQRKTASTMEDLETAEKVVDPKPQTNLSSGWLNYHIKAGANYNALSSTEIDNQNNAYIYSGLSPKLELGLIFNWDLKTQTGFVLGAQIHDFTLDGSLNLDSANAQESYFSFYYQKRFTRWQWKLELSTVNELLLKTKTSNTLELVNVISPETSLSLGYILMQSQNMVLDFSLHAGALIPFDNGDLQYKSGSIYKSAINQSFFKEGQYYEASFYYLQKDMKTNEVEVRRKQLGLDLSWQF
tara:strand:+ start:8504 stop:9457 length:954 start_codon:yes stop_codon:yes gene_type:complete